LVTVRRTMTKRPQNEHVQCALEQVRALLGLFFHGRKSIKVFFRNGRHSTIKVKRGRAWKIEAAASL
jgi:hypothetical protein